MLRALVEFLSVGLKLLAFVGVIGLAVMLADSLPEMPEQPSDAATRHPPVYCISLAPDGDQFAAVSMNYRLAVGPLGEETFPDPADPVEEPIKWAVFSPTGDGLLLGCGDGSVRLWDPSGAAETRVVGRLGGTLWRLAVSRDGERVAGLSIHPAEIRVWVLATGKEVCRLHAFDSDPNAVDFSADGRRILTHSWSGALGVWDARTGRHLRTLTGDAGGVGCVAGAPDGRGIASGDAQGWVRLRDIRTGAVRWEAKSGRLYMRALVYSPDGRRLACGGYLGRVSLLDAETGATLAEAEAHQGAITTLTFSPDGGQLISSGEDGTVCIWSVPGLDELHRVHTPPDDESSDDM